MTAAHTAAEAIKALLAPCVQGSVKGIAATCKMPSWKAAILPTCTVLRRFTHSVHAVLLS